MPLPRKGPFKGKGEDAAPTQDRGSAAADPSGDGGRRSPVQGWTLIGGIAIHTTNLPLAVRAAQDLRGTLLPAGRCHINGVAPQFYRHIGALP